MDISLPTLTKWARQFETKINNLKMVALESCLPHHGDSVKRLRSLSLRVENALENTQFSRLSFDQLLRARQLLQAEVETHRAKVAAWKPAADWDDEPGEEQSPTPLSKAA